MRIVRPPGWVFLSLLLVSGVTHAAGCDAPVGKDFPQVPVTESKLSATALLRLNQEIDTEGFDVRGLLILQACRLVFERYKKEVERDDNHALYSIPKSITATLAGRLLLEGRITSLSTPLAVIIRRPIFVADIDWDKLQAIQLEHAMRMRSGFQWEDKGDSPGVNPSLDTLREGIKLPLAEKPGAKFKYGELDPALVGIAISDSTGQSLPDAAQTLLFGPLQIPKPPWDYKDRAGRYFGNFGLRLRPMDMLKIGQLYLQQGRWNGAQLLSQEFVNAVMPMDGPHDAGYGLFWFTGKNPDLGNVRFFYAAGRKAQRIYVFPQWDMVVAVVAALMPEDEQKMLQPLLRGLKAAMEGGPVDQEAVQKLNQVSAAGFNGSRGFAGPNDMPRKAQSR